jgi:hypothetical protein
MGKKSKKKKGGGGAKSKVEPTADDIASLESIGPMLESLKRIGLEKEVKTLLEKRTELLKKHIAYLKLHEEVREAAEEEKSKGVDQAKSRYPTLLAQLDDEMAELSEKRKLVDSELQEKMILLGENSKSLLGVDDAEVSAASAAAPFDSSHFTPAAATKLSSLEGKKRIADLKRQRAVTLQQLRDCANLFQEVSQDALATAKNDSTESESDSMHPAINDKCVALLARIQNEMDELQEKAANIEKTIEEETVALAGTGMGVSGESGEGGEGKGSEDRTISHAAAPPMPPPTAGAVVVAPAPAEEGFDSSASTATPPTVTSGDDGLSAALQKLDAYDAELRAACTELGDTKGELQELYAESTDKQQAEEAAAAGDTAK